MGLSNPPAPPAWSTALRRTAALWARRDLGELLAISAEALGRYKLRTALSILGIVLGVAAVIAMMSVSDGARRRALQQVEMLGLDNLVARSRPVLSGQPGQAPGLTVGDVDRLRALIPLSSRVAPLVERYTTISGPARRQTARVLGVTAEYGAILRISVARGRLLAPIDDRRGERVSVLGAVLARALFGLRSPLGEGVRIEGDWYRVVGVLEDRAVDPRGVGTIAARDLNTLALVPLASLAGVGPGDHRQKVDEIWIQVSESGRVAEVGRVLERTLAVLHRGAPDFEVVVPRELLAQRQRTQRTFAVVVGSVAVLSLLVGGIGIMNIMLASVLERTREIGIRRTVGATRRDVTLQFLTESLLMTLTGGLAGILLGVSVSFGITAFAGWPTWISPASVVLALAVSFGVGLGFGIYPARKAASLEPIDAMRYE